MDKMKSSQNIRTSKLAHKSVTSTSYLVILLILVTTQKSVIGQHSEYALQIESPTSRLLSLHQPSDYETEGVPGEACLQSLCGSSASLKGEEGEKEGDDESATHCVVELLRFCDSLQLAKERSTPGDESTNLERELCPDLEKVCNVLVTLATRPMSAVGEGSSGSSEAWGPGGKRWGSRVAPFGQKRGGLDKRIPETVAVPNSGGVSKRWVDRLPTASKKWGERLVPFTTKRWGDRLPPPLAKKSQSSSGNPLALSSADDDVQGEIIKRWNERLIPFPKKWHSDVAKSDKRWGDRLNPFTKKWGDRLTPFSKRWGDRLTPFNKRWGDRLTPFSKRWGDRLSPFTKRWGDRLSPFTKRWGDRLPPSFHSTKRDASDVSPSSDDNNPIMSTDQAAEKKRWSERQPPTFNKRLYETLEPLYLKHYLEKIVGSKGVRSTTNPLLSANMKEANMIGPDNDISGRINSPRDLTRTLADATDRDDRSRVKRWSARLLPHMVSHSRRAIAASALSNSQHMKRVLLRRSLQQADAMHSPNKREQQQQQPTNWKTLWSQQQQHQPQQEQFH